MRAGAPCAVMTCVLVVSAVTVASAQTATPTTSIVAHQHQGILPVFVDAGEAVQAELSAQAVRAPDGTPYDCYAINTRAGDKLTVTVRSAAFDAVISISRGALCSAAALQYENDNFEAGSKDARVSFTAAGGRYLILARASTQAAQGQYSLSLDSESLLPGSSSGSAGVQDDRRALMNQQVAAHRAQVAEEQARIAAEERRRAQEEEARRQAAAERANSGSLLGTLLVAGAGAATAAAYGGDTAQILGGALKGAQIANPESAVANALGSQADTLIAGGSGSTGSTASSGGGYSTKPNLAAGACPGFTESNYRSVAVSGGGDQQLYTMCGQAFEYYVMYKRAIAQGYSEADAKRTYAAHEQAANTARNFTQTHRAN